MGSTTAALPKKLQNAITERMRLSLLRGDTPFDKARLADAAQFVGELASQRTRGRSAMAIESISDERRLTRIAIINDDMPFLVDLIAATIAALGLSIDRLVHPVIPVERDSKGKLEAHPRRRSRRRILGIDDLHRSGTRRRQDPPPASGNAQDDAGRCARRSDRLARCRRPCRRTPSALLRRTRKAPNCCNGSIRACSRSLAMSRAIATGDRTTSWASVARARANCLPKPPTTALSPGSRMPRTIAAR